MELRRLGRTGLDVSAVSLGTAGLASAYGIVGEDRHLPPSDEEATLLVKGAVDRGINFLDTARLYGSSEEVIGRVLEDSRADLVLATKVDVSGAADARGEIERAVETSLRFLRTEWVDLLYLHNATTSQLQDETILHALAGQKESGTVRHVGATIYSQEEGSAALRSDLFEVIQFPYNIFAADSWSGFISSAHKVQAGLVARSVLLKGVLSERSLHLPPALHPLEKAVARLCDAFGITRAELPTLAIRFVLSAAEISSAVLGATRFQEMALAVDASAAGPLTPQEFDQLKDITVPQDFLNPSRWSEEVL